MTTEHKPKTATVILRTAAGDHDITEELRVFYDGFIANCHMASSWYEEEERQAIARVGVLMGFELPTCEALYDKTRTDWAGNRTSYRSKCTKVMTHEGPHGDGRS